MIRFIEFVPFSSFSTVRMYCTDCDKHFVSTPQQNVMTINGKLKPACPTCHETETEKCTESKES